MKKSFTSLSFAVLWFVFQIAAAGAAGIGIVTGVSGEATVRRDPTPQSQKVKFKDDLFWLDTLNTGAGSRLRALIQQKSVITMKEHSQLQLREEAGTAAQPKKKSIVNLLAGSIRTVVDRDMLKETDFEVRTNLAVAAIRGSDLIGDKQSDDEVNFYTGRRASATLFHSDPAVGGRDLGELQRARVFRDRIEISDISESEYRRLSRALGPRGAQSDLHRQARIGDSLMLQASFEAVKTIGLGGVFGAGRTTTPDGAVDGRGGGYTITNSGGGCTVCGGSEEPPPQKQISPPVH
ncbi:MAG: FecR domain-containing protein [Deltaproteobacteria bacterium]|nr:FecR domain-containing protein [Deltaproteobacteria bacterium]